MVCAPAHKAEGSEEVRRMHAYWRAANDLSVGQIYLSDNPALVALAGVGNDATVEAKEQGEERAIRAQIQRSVMPGKADGAYRKTKTSIGSKTA